MEIRRPTKQPITQKIAQLFQALIFVKSEVSTLRARHKKGLHSPFFVEQNGFLRVPQFIDDAL